MEELSAVQRETQSQLHIPFKSFFEIKGTSIEKFYLSNKVEKVEELLVYEELSLTEIAYRLHYSSVAHLSNQFKKMTGLTHHISKISRIKRAVLLEMCE